MSFRDTIFDILSVAFTIVIGILPFAVLIFLYTQGVVNFLFFSIGIILLIGFGLSLKYHRGLPAGVKKTLPLKLLTEISVFHPRYFSKGHTSPISVRIHDPLTSEESEHMLSRFNQNTPYEEISEKHFPASLSVGQTVTLQLCSLDLDLSPSELKKVLTEGVNEFDFNAKPKDVCNVGEQTCTLIIKDESGNLLQSNNFSFTVVDYAIDHVSKPFLMGFLSIVGYAGSILMFVLTAIENLDSSLGLPSGTAAAMLSTLILGSNYLNYHKLNKTS